jgi:CBS domain-containing protein
MNEKPSKRIGQSTFHTFSNTLAGLARGLHVRHIATFNIISCSPDEETSNVLNNYPEFDQIPVKEGDRIIGVLERIIVENPQKVFENMRILDDSVIVAAELPLEHFLPLMADQPFYSLVLDGAQIQGIVTRSDLLKLPVRLLAFTLATSMETMMKDVVSHKLPIDENWFGYLSPGRQEKILARQAEFEERRMDPPLLDLTDYCDKYTILLKHFGLGKQFKSDLVKIEELRNSIAHGRSYADDEPGLKNFIFTLERAQYWINYLNEEFLNEASNL